MSEKVSEGEILSALGGETAVFAGQLPVCPYCNAVWHRDSQHWLHGDSPAGTTRCIECFKLADNTEWFK